MINKKTVFVSLLIASGTASAEQLKGGYPGCISEDLFDQMVSALVKKDDRAVGYLLKNGCVMAKSGLPITVLDRGWGTSKVRVYIGDQSVVLWTNSENIQ
ncbi:hypothetical protein BOW53_02830 [Solemya pervernicosa gill symbiont]|uniref:Uncharacterized protein n=1 Tax=Solemya pervernicosa gill symbiont TaxID=642797 RepID=A0A1T2L971_9GAMM|nr:hypothetical protein [Solemya pervernicosa gill symbiont]OOZ41631.1 hypothetical protein BOW53_02830 [Solemya pervernicosa gill symbiont]